MSGLAVSGQTAALTIQSFEDSHSGSLLSIKMNGHSFIAMITRSSIIGYEIEPSTGLAFCFFMDDRWLRQQEKSALKHEQRLKKNGVRS